MSDLDLITLEEAESLARGALTKIALDGSMVMDRIVSRPKEPANWAEDWTLLGELADHATLQRVGDSGVRNDGFSSVEPLTAWANHSWWRGYVSRTREAPASEGGPSLTCLETEERSSRTGPVLEACEYDVLASSAAYEIDAGGKIARLQVSDQHVR